MSFEQILFEFNELRTYERMFGMAIGAFSILLGYMLFKSGIETPQSAIVKIGDYEFKFLKVAPGIFFSLFGIILVGYISYNHPTLEKIKTTITDIKEDSRAQKSKAIIKIKAGFSDTEYDELSKFSRPINSAIRAIKEMPSEIESGKNLLESQSYGILIQSVNQLKHEINNKIFKSFPLEVHEACSGKGKFPENYTKDICIKIDELKKGELK